MRVKSSHIRQNISTFINKSLNSPIKDDQNNDNYSTAKFGELNKEINLPSSSKRYFRTLTPKIQRIPINKFSDKENISMNNDYNINYPTSNEGLNYSKDYINEINRIHNKEKEALQYKINTLENNVERLKLNFQNETKLMEERINNILREKKNMEEKYNQIIEMTIKEKDEKIILLTNENNILKEKHKIMEEKGKEKDNYMTKEINELNKEIENLKNALINARKENGALHKNHMNKISEMAKSNSDNIKNLNELHKKEIDEIYNDGKVKNDKLLQQVENDYNKIEFLKIENHSLKENLRNLSNDYDNLLNENKEIKSKLEDCIKNLEISNELNDKLKKNYEKIKADNNNMKSQFDYYDKTIQELKKELFLINDSYNKKEKEFNNLLEQSEKIRKNFTNNMFDNEELEYKNIALKQENEELRKDLRYITDRQCNPYSSMNKYY
jgi:hypothetical protein